MIELVVPVRVAAPATAPWHQLRRSPPLVALLLFVTATTVSSSLDCSTMENARYCTGDSDCLGNGLNGLPSACGNVGCDASTGLCRSDVYKPEGCSAYRWCAGDDSLCKVSGHRDGYGGVLGALGLCDGWANSECTYAWCPPADPSHPDFILPSGRCTSASQCKAVYNGLLGTKPPLSNCGTVTCENSECKFYAWRTDPQECKVGYFEECGGDDALCTKGPPGAIGRCVGWANNECVYFWDLDVLTMTGQGGGTTTTTLNAVTTTMATATSMPPSTTTTTLGQTTTTTNSPVTTMATTTTGMPPSTTTTSPEPTSTTVVTTTTTTTTNMPPSTTSAIASTTTAATPEPTTTKTGAPPSTTAAATTTSTLASTTGAPPSTTTAAANTSTVASTTVPPSTSTTPAATTLTVASTTTGALPNTTTAAASTTTVDTSLLPTTTTAIATPEPTTTSSPTSTTTAAATTLTVASTTTGAPPSTTTAAATTTAVTSPPPTTTTTVTSTTVPPSTSTAAATTSTVASTTVPPSTSTAAATTSTVAASTTVPPSTSTVAATTSTVAASTTTGAPPNTTAAASTTTVPTTPLPSTTSTIATQEPTTTSSPTSNTTAALSTSTVASTTTGAPPNTTTAAATTTKVTSPPPTTTTTAASTTTTTTQPAFDPCYFNFQCDTYASLVEDGRPAPNECGDVVCDASVRSCSYEPYRSDLPQCLVENGGHYKNCNSDADCDAGPEGTYGTCTGWGPPGGKPINCEYFWGTKPDTTGINVRINEVSDSGTTDGTCEGNDWVELYLPREATGGADLSLAGYTLHDSKGRFDDKAYTFPAEAVITSEEYLVLCKGAAGSFQFGISGTDSVTLLDASGTQVSATGDLTDLGDDDITYMYDEGSGEYKYTASPTPGGPNAFTAPPAPPAFPPDALRIDEVSDSGTPADGTCGGKDWVELYLPVDNPDADSSGFLSLANYTLHDSKGPNDEDAFTFPSDAMIPRGGHIVLCKGGSGFQFGIGKTDDVTLLDADGNAVSSTEGLPGLGQADITYMYDEATGAYVYTSSPTPGAPNVLTPYDFLKETRDRLVAQNALGSEFFDMDDNGDAIPNNPFGPVVDLRLTMNASVYDKMRAEATYEVWSPFESAVITTTGVPDDVLLSLPSPGRIRPKGNSNHFLSVCQDLKSMPYAIDWDHTNKSQTLFGVERLFLRHGETGSYAKEWAVHRMLAKFGLPHMRTRHGRLYVNDEFLGFYTMMEAPDQMYVYQRSFPNFDPSDFGLYKAKDSSFCYFDDTKLRAAVDRIDEPGTPPYVYERGAHRPLIPVLMDSFLCDQTMNKDYYRAVSDDVALTFVRATVEGKNCGEFLVDDGMFDRDLGDNDVDPRMTQFLNDYMALWEGSCSSCNMADDVDVPNLLKNLAVYAVTMNMDSALAWLNNYYLTYAGADAGGWKLIQYDHDGLMRPTYCDSKCDVHWSILTPTCEAAANNPLFGRLLTDPTHHATYVDYVREFFTTVLTDPFLDRIQVQLEAIRGLVTDDEGYAGDEFWAREVSGTDVWDYGDGLTTVFLPMLRARTDSILTQLAAIDQGDLVWDPSMGTSSEMCVDWRDQVPP